MSQPYIQQSYQQPHFQQKGQNIQTSQLTQNSIYNLQKAEQNKSHYSGIQDFRQSYQIRTNNLVQCHRVAELHQLDLQADLPPVLQEEYNDFKRNFPNFHLDKDGNVILRNLTTMKQQKPKVVNRKNIQAKKSQVMEKNRVIDFEQQSKPLLKIKQRFMQKYDELQKLANKQQIIEDSKNLLEEGHNYYEIEKSKNVQEICNLKTHISDEIKKNQKLQQENEELKSNVKLVESKLTEIQIKFDRLKEDSINLEKFIPQYTLLNSKFPEFNAQQIIGRIEELEKLGMNQQENISALEEEKLQIDATKKKMQLQFSQKQEMMAEQEQIRLKEIKIQKERLNQEQLEASGYLAYKKKYEELDKKLREVFVKWIETNKVYEGQISQVTDPIKMLEKMEDIDQIKTDDKLQKQLRQMILHAYMILRKHAPEQISKTKPHPTELYKIILKQFEKKVDKENERLTKKVTELEFELNLERKMYSQITKDQIDNKIEQLKQILDKQKLKGTTHGG